MAARVSSPTPASGPGLQSVGRALQVLQLFGEHDTLGARAVAANLGLNPAVAHRLLATLADAQFLVQDPASRAYRLGPCVGYLGDAYHRVQPFARAAQQVLGELSRQTGETTALHVLRDGHRICLSQHESDHRLRYSMVLHTPMPLTNGATDQVMRAFAFESELDDVVAALRAAASGTTTPAMMGLDSADTLVNDYESVTDAELSIVRSRGWAWGMGAREAGVGSVAAPVRRHELFVVTVFGPEQRIEDASVEQLGVLVHEAARRLEAL